MLDFLCSSSFLIWQAVGLSYFDLLFSFIMYPRGKKKTNQCLFTLFLDSSQFLLDFQHLSDS